MRRDMKHLVDFETAKALKERGYEQPMPEAGQFWYDEQGGVFVVCMTGRNETNFCSHIREWNLSFVLSIKGFGNMFFAPTSADLLGGAAMDVYSCALRWMAEKEEADYWENESKQPAIP